MMSSTLLKAVEAEIETLELMPWLTPFLGKRLALLCELRSHLKARGN